MVLQRTHSPVVQFLQALEEWLTLREGLQCLRVELHLDAIDADGDTLKLVLCEEGAREFIRPLLPILVERASNERAEASRDLDEADATILKALERAGGDFSAERRKEARYDDDLPF